MSALFQKCIAFLVAFFSVLINGASVSQISKKDAAASLQYNTESYMCDSIEYAYNIKNSVQCSFANTKRTVYLMSNNNMTLSHRLNGKRTADLVNKNGDAYINGSFKSFYTLANGKKIYFENSVSKGRVNTIRLGDYYYESHVRDLASSTFKVDKAFHVYGDRLYMQYSLLSTVPTEKLNEFGSEIRIPVKNTDAVNIKDSAGVHTDLNGVDFSSVEYAAFDIKDVGTVGFIVPADGSSKALVVERTSDEYVVTQYASYTPYEGINDYNEEGGYSLNNITFGCRIYTDDTHGFDGIGKASHEERNPVTVTVGVGNSEASYIGYDALRGCYTLQMKGTNFNYAYANPDEQFYADVNVEGCSDDRVIYIRAFTTSGGLEAAAVLDENNTLMPIEVQVSKNFGGDGGESFYGAKDRAYGDAFFPLKTKSGSQMRFRILHLYQNWGNVPLKQLSSIEYHISYYHLSTGTTESNCIAPYSASQKNDGFYLPDFRNRSGNMWTTQPQFNSMGIPRFVVQHTTKSNYGEYTGGIIDSCGLAYSDITNHFSDPSGKFTYTLRHVEMPQTDENRTYYSLDIDFEQDVTYLNFKDNFDLFSINGRMNKFNKADYLNENNIPVSVDVNTGAKKIYYKLGSENPFFGFYNITEDTRRHLDENFGCNFALIVKDSNIVINGEKSDIPFVFREFSTRNSTDGALTLDAGYINFKKGDSIHIDMVLLPWGTGLETSDENVLNVRYDSALCPISVTATQGSVVRDAFIPKIKSDNGFSRFTLTGGRNNTAVVVSGCKTMIMPELFEKINGEWQKVELASANGYDGYTVKMCDDGTYEFSFVVTMDSPEQVREFKTDPVA